MRYTRVLFTVLSTLGVLLVGVATLNAQSPQPQQASAALGAGFTYQGQLKKSGAPVSAACSMTFSLWDAPGGPAQVGSNQVINPVTVTNGLFSVLLNGGNQFGATAFDGSDRWLQIAAQCPGDVSPVTLSRQQLSASPYALYSLGNWGLHGNAGTTGANYLGTTDNMSLTIGVSGTAALRVFPHNVSPSLVGGSSGNSVPAGVLGATIGGGGQPGFYANVVSTNFGTVGGGEGNLVTGAGGGTVSGGSLNTASGGRATIGGGESNVSANFYSTVGGGNANRADGVGATVGGGDTNRAGGKYGTVSGGYSNTASVDFAGVGGGSGNTAGALGATVGGGITNTAGGQWSVVSGGTQNSAAGLESVIGGGRFNSATLSETVIGGGFQNSAISTTATVAGGNNNTAAGLASTVGGGISNLVTGQYATVAGGSNGGAAGDYGAVGGGINNFADGQYATVAGGGANSAIGLFATIGGGDGNAASGYAATIPGGESNNATLTYTLAAGRRATANKQGAFVWADSNAFNFNAGAANQFDVRATGGVSLVTGIDGGGSPTHGVFIAPNGTATVGGLNVNSTTTFARIQGSTFAAGAGGSGVNVYTITFPLAFASAPRVLVTARGGTFSGNPVGDTFAVTTRQVTTTYAVVNVWFASTGGGGWSQSLSLDWLAWE